ncbi:MAG: hydroxymethylglutaryl-CoA lyase [Acinetobacter populi]|jgi:hydroxymethylglutaryl-CoA lyase|uniref:hydroxymethylglutaryl-CoA lyase n=1 Tax=Acinetobacter populi TaxID=1582270 RepID=UPI0023578692|nr:hydroxymethylglutaryl-CoA lyase [Acinetobacter populi]MCH4246945.1 hydroxymethylglutaryl-CoA lyase [Acinetobacter populi]
MTTSPDTLIVQEVAPRDGLQIEPTWVPTTEKIKFINALSHMGFSRIEAGSFVSPKAIPALRDGDEVFKAVTRHPDIIYVALIPNLKGALRALDAQADELNLVLSASQTHNLANMRMTKDKSFLGFAEISTQMKELVKLNGTVATTFGCPFEGKIDPNEVMRLVENYLALGIQNITLADTTGMANPVQVKNVVRQILTLITPEQLTLHFHNTRGLGLCNVLAAYEIGARRFDSAIGGLGGCPFAPGASGNICTEDLVNMCQEIGIPTTIDLEQVIQLSRKLPALLGHDTPSQLAKAGPNHHLHSPPDYIKTLV